MTKKQQLKYLKNFEFQSIIKCLFLQKNALFEFSTYSGLKNQL